MNTPWTIGTIVALIIAFFWQRNKAETSEGLEKNLATKQQVTAIDAKEDTNNAALAQEAQTQDNLKAEIAEINSTVNTVTEIADFLNKQK